LKVENGGGSDPPDPAVGSGWNFFNEKEPPREAEYQVIGPLDRRKLTQFLIKEGQFLLPMVKLIEQGEAALDEMIDVMGRASIEAVLERSAMEVAGAKHKGREGGAIRWHGRQNGLVPLAERKVKVDRPGRRRLFVIDGAKALRNAIAPVHGSDNPVQRCRQHKLRNVLAHRPKEKHDQARSTIRAAWKLEAEEGIKRWEPLARWYEKDHPSAASSIREGLEERFTIHRLGLPGMLRRCLGTTNLIDSSHSGMRQRTRRVTNGQNGSMALRWAASALEATATNFRKIMGHQQLWIFKAYLDEPRQQQETIAEERRVG
jgi:transposase-like protein